MWCQRPERGWEELMGAYPREVAEMWGEAATEWTAAWFAGQLVRPAAAGDGFRVFSWNPVAYSD